VRGVGVVRWAFLKAQLFVKPYRLGQFFAGVEPQQPVPISARLFHPIAR
jgi:hypothetical protein